MRAGRLTVPPERYQERRPTQDDAIDAQKLAGPFRGGYIKRVSHPESFDQAVFKRHVGLCHYAVRQRV